MNETFYAIKISAEERSVIVSAIEDLIDVASDNEKLLSLASGIYYFLGGTTTRTTDIREIVLTSAHMSVLLLALENYGQETYDQGKEELSEIANQLYNTFDGVVWDKKTRKNVSVR